MQLFYSKNIEDELLFLDQEEARHCSVTLRKKPGDLIHVVDGKGNLYDGRLITVDKRKCTVAIEKTVPEFGKLDSPIHIAIAPTKNISRLEWFLEKTTEFGISEISPILCTRSERKHIRIDRLEKILITAMKQSLKGYCPKINPLQSFASFIESSKMDEVKYIAHCEDHPKSHLIHNYSSCSPVTILIGPEGDFTHAEIGMALAAGYKEISLGKSRLRTETAGIAACQIIHLKNEILSNE